MKGPIFLWIVLSASSLVESVRKQMGSIRKNDEQSDLADDEINTHDLTSDEGAVSDAVEHQSGATAIGSETHGVTALCEQTHTRYIWQTRLQAFKALRDLGSLAMEGVRCITEGLEDPDDNCRSAAQQCMRNLGIQHADKRAMSTISGSLSAKYDVQTRRRAIEAFLFIGEPAHVEADAIVRSMGIDDDESIRNLAYQVWKKIGKTTPERAVRTIASLTSTTDYIWQTRLAALQALERLGEKAMPAASEVTLSLVDDDDLCRQKAVQVFFNIRRTTNAASVRQICKYVSSDYIWQTRKLSLDALYLVGDIVKQTCLDQVTLALVADHDYVIDSAKQVLASVNKADRDVTAMIARSFLSTRYIRETRISAIKALKWLSERVDGGGSWAKPAMNEIITAMSDSDQIVASYAREAITMIRNAEKRPKVKERKTGNKTQPVVRSSREDAEDADCYCFKNVDYDKEAEYQKVDFAECAGMKGTEYQCASHCAKKTKYHVILSSEKDSNPTQTISYCQDDGDCKCLDADDSKDTWKYKKEASFRLTNDRRLQGINLGECYSKCNKACKAKGWSKGGCIWPVGL